MSAAALSQYLFAPIRTHERRASYRSMRFLMVVSSFCAGLMTGTTLIPFVL